MAFMKELFKELVVEGIIRGSVRGLGDMVKERSIDYVKKSFEEHRGELFAFVRLELAPGDADRIMEQQRRRAACEPYTYDSGKRYKPGDENKMVKLLTKLYMHLSAPEEHDKRRKAFTDLARMDDRTFDLALDFLEHDWFVQFIKRGSMEIQEFNDFLNRPDSIINRTDQRFINFASRLGVNL